jgi:MoxR-like ATPase
MLYLSVNTNLNHMSNYNSFEADNFGIINRKKLIAQKGKQELVQVDDSEIVYDLIAEYDQIISGYNEELSEMDNNPEVLSEVSLRNSNLIKALRKDSALEKSINTLQNNLLTLKNLPKNKTIASKIQNLNQVINTLSTEKEFLIKSSPEAYFGLHLKKLKLYNKQLDNGEMVKTNYINLQKQEILESLNANKPLFIHGHLGSGKTETAIETARDFSSQDPLILSGTKFISLGEIYGHQKLARSGYSEANNYLESVETELQNWIAKQAATPSQEEINRAHDRIIEAYKPMLTSSTISDFHLGPIYKAMQEGRVLIIDEVNSIPHNILISLNHLLTRKVGDKVIVQQDSSMEITIAKGFGIILTGNLNTDLNIYKEREDIDPAFFDRLDILEQDYLPQAKEGNLEDNYDSDKELFEVLLAKLMDKNGNVIAPNNSLEKIWNLCTVARSIQDIFSGKVTQMYSPGGATAKIDSKQILSTSCSMRPLLNIIDSWQKDGFVDNLDTYIYTKFIKKSSSTAERHFLYQIFESVGFFDDKNYTSNIVNTGGNISEFEIIPKKNADINIEELTPREYIEDIYGKVEIKAASEFSVDTLKVSQYEKERVAGDDLKQIENGSLWGYMSKTTGSIIILPKFKGAYKFFEGRAGVYDENGKGGFILPNGEYLIEPKYDKVWPFKNGLAKVKKDGQYGLVDLDGLERVEICYELISGPDEFGNYFAGRNGEGVKMDKSGTVIEW